MLLWRNQFYIALYAAALAISVSALVFTLLQKRTDRPQNKWFMSLMIVVTINAIAEICVASFELNASDIRFYYLMEGALNLYFIFHTLLSPMLYCYVSSVTGKNRRRKRRNKIILSIPFVFSEILVLLNPIIHCVYYFDQQLVFNRNWAEYIIYVIAFFYFILSFIEIVFSWNAITPRRSVALIYLFTLTMLGVMVQLIFINIKCEMFAEALALMGAMFAVESEDDRIDADTGIYNRRALQMDMYNMLMMKEQASLIFIKINNANIIERVTRSINYDTLDIEVSEYLKTLVPRYRIYHPNKESFIIVCSIQDNCSPFKLRDSISSRFNEVWEIYGTAFKLDAIVLKADIPTELSSYNDIVYVADTLIPPAVALNNGEMKWIMRRAEIESAIKKCLFYGGFEVVYQPTICNDGETVHGAEALVRMNDDELGPITPDEFIPIAEQIGLVDDIDDFVLNEVCGFIKSGLFEDYKLDCINVNLSVIQCLKPGFFKYILETVDYYGVEHSKINFEITESVGPDDYDVLSMVTHQLKSAGFLLSMDDYGTGYSNVEGIFSLEFDVVKIDKSILWNAVKDDRGRIILENSIRMIHGLGCKVLVEGVETEEQMKLLQAYGVDYLQGFHFAKPLAKDSFLKYLSAE